MRELPAGGDGILLDFSAEASPQAQARRCARALQAAVDDGRLPACDVVPAATTILVEALPGTGLDQLAVFRVVHAARREFFNATSASEQATAAPWTPDVEIPTVYDGADLEEAAALVGVGSDQLARAHRAVLWRVQFMGFAPGFGYLIPDPSNKPEDCEMFQRITRRPQSRTAVPAGAVAVAAGYSAVYPRRSPGGWFLLGHTATTMWDSTARPPALLAAGTTVRFVTASAS